MSQYISLLLLSLSTQLKKRGLSALHAMMSWVTQSTFSFFPHPNNNWDESSPFFPDFRGLQLLSGLQFSILLMGRPMNFSSISYDIVGNADRTNLNYHCYISGLRMVKYTMGHDFRTNPLIYLYLVK